MNRFFRDKATCTSTFYCHRQTLTASRFRVYWNVVMALSPRKRRRPIRESWCVDWAVSLLELTHLSAFVANDEKSYFSGGEKRQPRRYGCIHRLLGSLRSNDATQRERGLKSEFAFFQSLSQWFLPTYFVNCRWTLLKLNSWEPYPNSEREINFRRCLFTSSI